VPDFLGGNARLDVMSFPQPCIITGGRSGGGNRQGCMVLSWPRTWLAAQCHGLPDPV